MLRIPTLAIAAALLVLPAAAPADDIVATGRAGQPLNIVGPDAQGHYTLRIRIADLDPASPAGWRIMADRVHMGTALLCDAAAPQPFGGYYYREQRECLSDSGAIAEAQMSQARRLAGAGTPVAVLDVRF